MKQYNAGIIGLGIMGRRMIANFARHPAFKVSSVWDPSSKSLKATQQEFQDLHYSETPEQLINGIKPDLLYIACPPEFHKQYAFCLLYTSPSPRDRQKSRMPSSA